MTASLSLWWNSIGASEPPSAGGIFALGNTVGKTMGFKDRGLGRGHFVTHSSLCLFVTSPLFLTLLVVCDSLPLIQGVTNATQLPQCQTGLHKLWYPGIRDRSTWSKFGAHGEHGDVFLFSNLGAL